MVEQIEIPFTVQMGGSIIIERYLQFLDRGESPSIAEILAFKQAPGIRTENTLIAAQNQERGGATLADQFRGNENLLQYRIQQARKHGYEPKATDFYDSSRAKFAGDPAAFTGSSQSLGDVRNEMERRGCGMGRGNDVIVAPETDVAPVPPKKLADHIVKRIKGNMIKENPDLAHVDQRDLDSEIKEKHGNKDKDAVE